jgi:hypothetical protein
MTKTILPIFLISGCITVSPIDPSKGKSGSNDTSTEDTDTNDPDTNIQPSVVWGNDSVSLEIANADEGAAYTWGIAENFGDCLNTGLCWTGEDCFLGFELSSGGNFLYCHPISGSSIELSYGANPDTIVEGATTLFQDPSFSTVTTHILDNIVSQENGSCWVWGADTSYYDEYDKTCNAM